MAMEGRHAILSRAATPTGKRKMTMDFFGQSGVGGFTGWRDDRWEQVRHYKGWVYVAISRIMDAVAQLMPQVSVCRGSPSPSLERIKHSRALVAVQEREFLTPAPKDHRLVRLVTDPNDPDTGNDIWADTVMFLNLTGSAYWWLIPDRYKLPSQIHVLPSHWVWPLSDKDHKLQGYDIRPVDGSPLSGGFIPKEDVVVFKKRSPLSKWDGYSPLQAGSTWVDCSDAMDRSRWHAFKNGINTDVAFEFEEGNEPETDAEYTALRAKIDGHYAGVEKAHKALLVPPGMRAKRLGFNIREADFPQSFEQMARAVLALFGVPSVVAGWGDAGAYGNVVASLASFAHFNINPLLSMLGQRITEKVACRFDEKLRVWWPDQAMPDPMVTEQQLRTDDAVGLRSINERRAARGLPPVSWGEERARSKPDGSGKRAKPRDERKDETKEGSSTPDSANGQELK